MPTSPSQSIPLPPRFPLDGVDAADLGDCVVFMPTDDKFYRGCVGESHRHAKIEPSDGRSQPSHQRSSAVTHQTISTITDARYGIYVILHHLITRQLHPICVDTTSGDTHACVRYGNFFRTLNYNGKAYFFESTHSSGLLPFSATLNGLEEHVTLAPAGETIMSLIGAESTRSVFINLNSLASLREIQESLSAKPNVMTFEIHAGNKESIQTLSTLLETHILFDVGFVYRPFCFSPITGRDVKQFTRIVANYPHRATHVMAISRDIPEVNELAYQLACLTPGPVEYSLVIEPHVPPGERVKPRLAEQVEVIVMPNRPPSSSIPESPFSGEIPVMTMATEHRNISRFPAS